jgi:arginine deiminase
MLHRPGDELKRLTPRNNDALLFDGLPWVDRAQEEHDAFAQALRDRGVDVVYLDVLLAEAFAASEQAREEVLDAALPQATVGPRLLGPLRARLSDLSPQDLAHTMIAGLALEELPVRAGLVDRMLGPHDFVIHPLPNVLFTRDSSVWLRSGVAITALALPARRRESSLTAAIYRHNPRFAGTPVLYGDDAHVEGGDVLVLAPGVLAVGVGQRTSPAGVELFAERLFAAEEARTVLAVPIAQDRATMHLDTVCTMVDRNAVVMYPQVARTLQAYVVEADGVDGPRPFLKAAAEAMGIDELRLIDTGLDPITAEREQWDDGNNTLAIEPGLVVAYERNRETNRRLEEEGIEVIRIAGSELGTGRGGPRCMSCPIERDD